MTTQRERGRGLDPGVRVINDLMQNEALSVSFQVKQSIAVGEKGKKEKDAMQKSDQTDRQQKRRGKKVSSGNKVFKTLQTNNTEHIFQC